MIRVLCLLGVQDSGEVRAEQLANGALHIQFHGSEDFLRHLPRNSGLKVTKALLLGKGRTRARPRFDEADVVVNAIADPDACRLALEEAESLLAQTRVPVINHPSRVLQTTRDGIAARLVGVEGIEIPRTLRLSPRRLAEVESLAGSGEVTYPFLFRPAGTHGGTQLDLIREPGELAALEKYPFDGRDYYMTEFVDFRSADGLYRKLRVFVVDGEPFIRHRIVSDHWNIHQDSRNRLMAGDPALQAEEARFVSSFRPETIPALKTIHERVGLDYFAIDGALREDGKLLVFEVNAGAKLALSGQPLPRHVQSIVRATRQMLRHRASPPARERA